jgi:hypothetical protein
MGVGVGVGVVDTAHGTWCDVAEMLGVMDCSDTHDGVHGEREHRERDGWDMERARARTAATARHKRTQRNEGGWSRRCHTTTDRDGGGVGK